MQNPNIDSKGTLWTRVPICFD